MGQRVKKNVIASAWPRKSLRLTCWPSSLVNLESRSRCGNLRDLVDPAFRVRHGKSKRDLVAGSQVCQFFWLLYLERHGHGVHIVADRLVAEQDRAVISLELLDNPSRREASQIRFARIRRRERYGGRIYTR